MDPEVYDPKNVVLGDKWKPLYTDKEVRFNVHPEGYKEPPVLHGVKCAICGSDKFNLGTGDYCTAIKCPNCEYEMVIHEG